MNRFGINMTVICNKNEVLSALRTNRDKHQKIVQEARHGYIDKAKKALKKKLEILEAGKISTLQFSLSPPQDMTEAYDTAIQMLELHREVNVTLSAQEVRQFVQDEWDWASSFLFANSAYSTSAALAVEARGSETLEFPA